MDSPEAPDPPTMPYAPLGSSPPGPNPSTSGAVGSLICGAFSLLTGCFPIGIVGIILGIRSRNKSRRDPHLFGGGGMALAGICLSIASFGSLWLLMVSLKQAREVAVRTVCSANLKGLTEALYLYAQDSQKALPCIAGQRAENDGILAAFDPAMRQDASAAAAMPSPTVDMWALLRSNNSTPKQFLCPLTTDLPDPARDTTAYYDFLTAAKLSYAYQYMHDPDMPNLLTTGNPMLPIMSDANPYIKGGVIDGIASDRASRWRGNSLNHPRREGQNVAFLDGHVQYSAGPDVGLKGMADPTLQATSGGDNCYTVHGSQSGAYVDPGSVAPSLTGSRGKCDLGSKADTCLVP